MKKHNFFKANLNLSDLDRDKVRTAKFLNTLTLTPLSSVSMTQLHDGCNMANTRNYAINISLRIEKKNNH